MSHSYLGKRTDVKVQTDSRKPSTRPSKAIRAAFMNNLGEISPAIRRRVLIHSLTGGRFISNSIKPVGELQEGIHRLAASH